ncbi:hypothetical protein GCM10020220_078330 [Nonomuraea rubra]
MSGWYCGGAVFRAASGSKASPSPTQHCARSAEVSAPERLTSCQPTTRFPAALARPSALVTNAAYSSCGIPNASSPPMCRYGPGVSTATSPSTSATNRHVTSARGSRNGTSGWAGSSSPPSSGYARTAASTCPGMSISGTTVTKRSAAYATISR